MEEGQGTAIVRVLSHVHAIARTRARMHTSESLPDGSTLRRAGPLDAARPAAGGGGARRSRVQKKKHLCARRGGGRGKAGAGAPLVPGTSR